MKVKQRRGSERERGYVGRDWMGRNSERERNLINWNYPSTLITILPPRKPGKTLPALVFSEPETDLLTKHSFNWIHFRYLPEADLGRVMSLSRERLIAFWVLKLGRRRDAELTDGEQVLLADRMIS